MAAEDAPMEVNIELGDDLSKTLYEASKQTWQNREGMFGELEELHASFSGLRVLPVARIKDPENVVLAMGDDGVGTKVEVAERQADHSTVAFDLFAMACDDAVVRGAEPIAVTTTLDVRQISDTPNTRRAITELAEGYVAAAKAAGVVVMNGEVAELGARVDGYRSDENDFNYNWAATVLWAAHKERLLTGHKIKPGDSLIGLVEQGFRSNGITDVRNAFAKEYGEEWHKRHVPRVSHFPLGDLVQRPSIIYSRFVTDLTGGYDLGRPSVADVTGVAHITGGGMPGKLGRMLEPSGYGVMIWDPVAPPKVMLHAQKLTEFSDEKAYSKWHMGPGMIIATSEPDKVLAHAEKQKVKAEHIGEVTKDPRIKIVNSGVMQETKVLKF